MGAYHMLFSNKDGVIGELGKGGMGLCVHGMDC